MKITAKILHNFYFILYIPEMNCIQKTLKLSQCYIKSNVNSFSDMPMNNKTHRERDLS